ncbi:hypothetical protein PENTCL1PPCAC_23859, partial [Pristionchus entomophagus]
ITDPLEYIGAKWATLECIDRIFTDDLEHLLDHLIIQPLFWGETAKLLYAQAASSLPDHSLRDLSSPRYRIPGRRGYGIPHALTCLDAALREHCIKDTSVLAGHADYCRLTGKESGVVEWLHGLGEALKSTHSLTGLSIGRRAGEWKGYGMFQLVEQILEMSRG